MLSTKTLAILFLFTLNMQFATSSGTQKTSSSSVWAFLSKKSKPKPTSKLMLKDGTDTTNVVQAVQKNTEKVVQAQGPSVPQVNKKFDKLFKQEKYDELFGLVESMGQEEFIKQLCLAVKTHDQYNKIIEHLRKHKMATLFHVHGNIGVVGTIIVNSSICDESNDVHGGDLEAALLFAFNNDLHDRVIELLEVRQKVTAEGDEQDKLRGSKTTFELFVGRFLDNLAPEKDGMALRRFLAHCEEKLRTSHSDILDTLCEMLVLRLRDQLDEPKAENLLIDMIGQHSLLTPVSFTKEFLYLALSHEHHSAFIKYGWAEVFQEGLKREYPYGGEELWRVMEIERSGQLTEKFPETADERAEVCKRFPTKKQKEEEWAQFALKNATILFTKLKRLDFIFGLISRDLLHIVAEYAISMADIDSTVSRSELIASNSV